MTNHILRRLRKHLFGKRLFGCLSVVFALGTGLPAAAEPAGAAVFGSYLDPALADLQRQRVGSALGISLFLAGTTIAGEPGHRIVSETMPERAARALIERASGAGFDAWYLSAPARTPAVDVASTEPIMIEPPIAAQTAPAPATETTPKAPVDPAVAAPLPNTNAMPMRIATRMENPDIVIDGHVDEAAWQAVDAYDNMRVMEPETLAEPTYATASRFIYTDEGLYVSAVMEQPPETLVARLSSRDQYINRDGFGITLDTLAKGCTAIGSP